MKKSALALVVTLVVALAFGPGPAAETESYEPDYYGISGADLLAPEELDDLLSPIALYPDPLIAQMLPAATFIDQIVDAARYVRRHGKSARIDDQPWDLSVRAVAHYPEVLFMMEENFDWTVSLGQAFIEQPQDVMDAIQRLRDYARAQGNLYSTREHQVIYEADFIRIVPARPQYLYVPVYDPQVVYVERYTPSYPFITFGIGFTIGAWLNRDCDWRQRRVYYHGWRSGGRGWVNRARPHIHDRRGVYINRRAAAINVNNRVVQHDTRVYRQQLRNESLQRRGDRRFSPPTRLDRPRPGRKETPRGGRIEQQRPGVIQQQRPGVIQQQRPVIQQPRPGVQQPPPAIKQPRPAVRQPRPGIIEQPRTPGAGQQREPGIIRQGPAAGQRRPSGSGIPSGATQPVITQPAVQQPAPATGQQTPAATGRQRQPAREGRGESRRSGEAGRKVMRQINRPAAPQPPAATATPARRVAPSPWPKVAPANKPATLTPAVRPRVVPAPTPTVTPVPRPPVVPAPTPTVTPAPRASETPASSSRPTRQPGPSRGTSLKEQEERPGPRAVPR